MNDKELEQLFYLLGRVEYSNKKWEFIDEILSYIPEDKQCKYTSIFAEGVSNTNPRLGDSHNNDE